MYCYWNKLESFCHWHVSC